MEEAWEFAVVTMRRSKDKGEKNLPKDTKKHQLNKSISWLLVFIPVAIGVVYFFQGELQKRTEKKLSKENRNVIWQTSIDDGNIIFDRLLQGFSVNEVVVTPMPKKGIQDFDHSLSKAFSIWLQYDLAYKAWPLEVVFIEELNSDFFTWEASKAAGQLVAVRFDEMVACESPNNCKLIITATGIYDALDQESKQGFNSLLLVDTVFLDQGVRWRNCSLYSLDAVVFVPFFSSESMDIKPPEGSYESSLNDSLEGELLPELRIRYLDVLGTGPAISMECQDVI